MEYVLDLTIKARYSIYTKSFEGTNWDGLTALPVDRPLLYLPVAMELMKLLLITELKVVQNQKRNRTNSALLLDMLVGSIFTW